MPPSDESMKIAGAFHKYSESGDKTLIKDIPQDKLEIALLQYSRDKGNAHYSAMEMRLNELKEASRTTKWSRDQKIAFGALLVAVIALFFQINNLEQKVQPAIEMKPQINNVINNVTEVKKEIANLYEMLKQQDEAKTSDNFYIFDLDKKVKKITPPESAGQYAVAIVLIELSKVPLKNSIVVSSQNSYFSQSTINIYHNIVELRFLKSIPRVLEEGTDFLNVTYIPDFKTKDELYSLNGMTYDYKADNVEFNFPIKENKIPKLKS